MKTYGAILGVAFCIPVLSGCSTNTIHLANLTPEQVQTAYERILHPSPRKEGRSTWRGAERFVFGLAPSAYSFARSCRGDVVERRLSLLGFWSNHSECRWREGLYERSSSWWWLLVPLVIKSERAFVAQKGTGVDFTLELYPANEGMLSKRLTQLRENLHPRRDP